ncbi:MAG: hypothetical protein ABWX61_04115 [Paenisporosarcina sp.]
MAFGIITVIGFTIVIGIVGVFVMHYITSGMVTRDSEVIDPKPEIRF